MRRFEDHRGELGDGELICILGPDDEVVEGVESELAQESLGEREGAVFDIEHAKAVAKSVDGDVESAAAVAQELAPAAGILDAAVAAAVDSGTGSGNDDDAVAVAKGGGVAGLSRSLLAAISAVRPDGGGEVGEFAGLFEGGAAGEANADVSGVRGQRAEKAIGDRMVR